jgi:hypothetical protein
VGPLAGRVSSPLLPPLSAARAAACRSPRLLPCRARHRRRLLAGWREPTRRVPAHLTLLQEVHGLVVTQEVRSGLVEGLHPGGIQVRGAGGAGGQRVPGPGQHLDLGPARRAPCSRHWDGSGCLVSHTPSKAAGAKAAHERTTTAAGGGRQLLKPACPIGPAPALTLHPEPPSCLAAPQVMEGGGTLGSGQWRDMENEGAQEERHWLAGPAPAGGGGGRARPECMRHRSRTPALDGRNEPPWSTPEQQAPQKKPVLKRQRAYSAAPCCSGAGC